MRTAQRSRGQITKSLTRSRMEKLRIAPPANLTVPVSTVAVVDTTLFAGAAKFALGVYESIGL